MSQYKLRKNTNTELWVIKLRRNTNTELGVIKLRKNPHTELRVNINYVRTPTQNYESI